MIAKRLREKMKEKGLKQKELAELAELSTASVSQYLAGKNRPNRLALSKLAQALEVEESWLSGKADLEKQYNTVKLSVNQAAKLMGASPQFIRLGVQRKELPFGYAMKMNGNRYVYHISTKKFSEYTGVVFE